MDLNWDIFQVKEGDERQDADETVFEIDNHSIGSNMQGSMFGILFKSPIDNM